MNKPVKFIVEIHDDITPADAFAHCLKVAKMGKMSNNSKQHCYVTVFGTGITVTGTLNKNSERFVVSKSENNSQK